MGFKGTPSGGGDRDNRIGMDRGREDLATELGMGLRNWIWREGRISEDLQLAYLPP